MEADDISDGTGALNFAFQTGMFFVKYLYPIGARISSFNTGKYMLKQNS